eukprot:m.163426 g.163426  ORF g.163426 m.163426 type:complete len:51 (+) comp23905_c0_seq1:2021-2173(+)
MQPELSTGDSVAAMFCGAVDISTLITLFGAKVFCILVTIVRSHCVKTCSG